MYTMQNCYIIKTIMQTMNVPEIIHIISRVVDPSDCGFRFKKYSTEPIGLWAPLDLKGNNFM